MPGPTERPPQSSPAAMPTGARWNIGRAALGLLLMVLCLGVLGWQVRHAGTEDVLRRLAAASPLWIGLALAATILKFVSFAARLAGITRRAVRVYMRDLLAPVMISQVLGLLVPGIKAGAVFVRAHVARRRVGGSLPDHLSANLIDQLALLASWIIAVIVVLPVLAWSAPGPTTRNVSLLTLGMVTAIAVAAVAAVRFAPSLRRWLDRPRGGRWASLASAASQTIASAAALVRDRRAARAGLLGGLTFVLLAAAAQYASFFAVGEAIPFWLAVLAVTAGTAAGIVVHTPGGVGVTELAQVSFLSQLGVPFEAATSAVLIMRGLHYATVACWGTPLLVREGLSPKAAFGDAQS